MVETEFYDGTKLLSMKDINGEKPEIYGVAGNRTGGKTTYFERLVVNGFIKRNNKFMLLYKFGYELENCAEKFYKDIGSLFFPCTEMHSKKKEKGKYHELYIGDRNCGYAVDLNSASYIKTCSHLFNDTACMFMDEFQNEDNIYVDNEVNKLISIHTSVARGQGKQVRRVPLYMCANTVSLINPYYVAWGISNRLTKDTKFLRGDGFVFEQNYNESASNAQKESPFNRAFANNVYTQYASENVYLNDNMAFIEKPTGNNLYVATIKFRGVNYAIREFSDQGIIYCDDKPDMTFPYRVSITTDDHNINYVILRNNDSFIQLMRFYFEHGCFRFKDLRCKEAVLNCVTYH